MSGATIGGIVGGVIGTFFGGNWQIGWMIGSAIGGAIDPQKIRGPSLGDAQTQYAQDGVPRAYGYGTLPPIKGNILWRSLPYKVKKEEQQGKGGPVTVTEHWERSYAIGICMGPITGYLIVRRNGQIVYDTRPDDVLIALGYTAKQVKQVRAAQKKFTEKVTFYYGTDDQMPDPVMQAIKGVNNVPAYRGYAYMVAERMDETATGGAVSQYEFVVSACGTRGQGPWDLTPVVWDSSTKTGGVAAVENDGASFFSGSNDAGYVKANISVSSGDWYWETTTGWELVSGSGINHYGAAGIIRNSDSAYGLVLGAIGGDGGAVFSDETLGEDEVLYPGWIPPPSTPRTAIIRNRLILADGLASWLVAIDDGDWVGIMTAEGGEYTPYAVSRGTSLDININAKRVWIYSVPDDFTYPVPDGSYPLAAGQGHNVPIPDAPGYFINPTTGDITGPPGTVIDRCTPSLGYIVAEECASRGVTSINVSELTDDVDGYRVASQSSVQANIQTLQRGYFFGASEYDGVLHFPKSVQPLTFALTVDDLVARNGDAIEWEQVKENDLLRKATMSYCDPDASYAITTQDWERRSSTIKANGEGSIDVPVTATRDWAKQAVDKTIRVAWSERDTCKLTVSIAQADRVTGEWGTVTDENGQVHTVRIEKIEDDGAERHLTMKQVRASAYESNATGVPSPLPAFPGSDIRGPTIDYLLNLPALRIEDDRPGLYWAASGLFPSWVGASLQIMRNGSWTTVATTTSTANIGSLPAPLAYSDPDYTDEWNTLSVSIPQSLSSTTWEQLLNGANAGAILYTDGTAEIVQWQDAELDGGNNQLTTLLRGRLDTLAGEHEANATFVVLDSSVQFVELLPSEIGTTLTYRTVTAGTDPDAAEPRTIDLASLESAREWSVSNLAVIRDGSDNVTVAWDGRPRLGSNVAPQQSSHFTGYRIEFTDGSTVIRKDVARTPLVIVGGVVDTPEVSTFTYSAADQAADFGSVPGSLDVTVYAVNDISGPGPGKDITV